MAALLATAQAGANPALNAAATAPVVPPAADNAIGADIAGVRPTNTGSVSIADAIAKAREIAAGKGIAPAQSVARPAGELTFSANYGVAFHIKYFRWTNLCVSIFFFSTKQTSDVTLANSTDARAPRRDRLLVMEAGKFSVTITILTATNDDLIVAPTIDLTVVTVIAHTHPRAAEAAVA